MQSDAQLVAEACGRAARVLGLSRDELSALVGKHRTSIDETLNRTGVKLSVFELLTARFWSQDIKLREL